MIVHVIPAASTDRMTLHNLLQMYLHDFSDVLPRAPDRDGMFPYPHLDAYWTDDRRRPFLITADGQLAGFALVRTTSVVTGSADVADMAEFLSCAVFAGRGSAAQRRTCSFGNSPAPGRCA